MSRPDWWPDWLPDACSEGHPYDLGVKVAWEQCPDCPAANRAGGHHVWFCGVVGCRAEPTRPPGHVGGAVLQR